MIAAAVEYKFKMYTRIENHLLQDLRNENYNQHKRFCFFQFGLTFRNEFGVFEALWLRASYIYFIIFDDFPKSSIIEAVQIIKYIGEKILQTIKKCLVLSFKPLFSSDFRLPKFVCSNFLKIKIYVRIWVSKIDAYSAI